MARVTPITIVVRRETASERRKTANDERRLNAEIGQLVRSWALLHDRLGSIFHDLVVHPDDAFFRPSVGHSIWHSIKSDLAQRQMLQAALKGKIGLLENTLRRIDEKDKEKKIRLFNDYIWLVNEITKMSHSRNDLVHAPIVFQLDLGASEYEPAVSDQSSDPRGDKLKERELYQFCAYCIDFCRKAMTYIHELSHHPAGRDTWPERPRWLSLSKFPTRKQPPHRKRSTPRVRPLPPSRA